MRVRITRHIIGLGIVFAVAILSLKGQWIDYPSPRTPRGKDGKPQLSAPVRHVSGGKPDLSGVWQVEPTAPEEMARLFGDLSGLAVPGDDPRFFSKFFINVLADFKPGEAPIRPDADALFRRRFALSGTDNPTARCLPLGLPGPMLLAMPVKIVQTPGLILVLQEADSLHRQIYTDGRPLPVNPQPSWAGYSVGRWERDTLVVDTSGFNDKSWLDVGGHPHSEALRLEERFHRRDFGHMDVAVNITDPVTFTRPFTIQFKERLLPDNDILETVCAENERDRAHVGIR